MQVNKSTEIFEAINAELVGINYDKAPNIVLEISKHLKKEKEMGASNL